MNNQSGKSPLIAAVLLIGFSVTLIAGITFWGIELYKSTIESSESKLSYFKKETKLKFEIKNAYIPEGPDYIVSVTIQNNAGITIPELIIHGYTEDKLRILIDSAYSLNLEAYEQKEISYPGNETFTHYEITPKIEGEGAQKSIKFIPKKP